MGASRSRKMCPCEQSSWDWVSARQGCSSQGQSQLSRRNSSALLLVMDSCSMGTALELWVQNRPWPTIPDWVCRSYAGRRNGVTDWNFRLVFVEEEGQGTEIPMFFQRCAFCIVSLFPAQMSHWALSFLFLEKDFYLTIKQCNSKGHNSNSVTPSLFRVLSLIWKGWNGPSLWAHILSSLCHYCGFNYKQCQV